MNWNRDPSERAHLCAEGRHLPHTMSGNTSTSQVLQSKQCASEGIGWLQENKEPLVKLWGLVQVRMAKINALAGKPKRLCAFCRCVICSAVIHCKRQ
jgi:hypothetical protein